MKNLIRSILREHIRNQKDMNYNISEFMEDIKSSFPDLKIVKERDSEMWYEVVISDYEKKYNSNKIKKLIDAWKNKLERYGITLGYDEKVDRWGEGRPPKIMVSFKNINTQRIIPNKFVFHFSDIEPSVVLTKGLIPKSSDEGNWSDYHGLSYPPVVFAANTYKEIWRGKYIYAIDTEKAPNAWWYDLNEFDPKRLWKSKLMIMTFDPVDPQYISVLTPKQHMKIKDFAKLGKPRKEVAKMVQSFIDNPNEETQTNNSDETPPRSFFGI